MHPLVHEKLGEFFKQEIKVPVMEPTDWVSSLDFLWKANGKPWVYLDPKDVNAAIHHDHYHTPTLDKITHVLSGSMHFTKLDDTSSYLCVILDYKPSLLTTFNIYGDVTDLSIYPGALPVPRNLSTYDGPNPGMMRR